MEHLAMENIHGDKMNYNPGRKGPLHERSCTDCFWFLIFIIFLVCWGVVSYYALRNGSIEKLIHPSDSDGRRCGFDSRVKNKPYLLFFDFTKCAEISSNLQTCQTPQVCVKECPKKNFLYDKNKRYDINSLKNDLICKTDVKLDMVTKLEEINTLIEHEKCARWYLKSTVVVGRCLPIKVWDGFVNITMTNETLISSRKTIEAFASVDQFFMKVFKNIDENKYIVLGISVASGFVSLFYIVLLRWVAKPCVWTTIFLFGGLLCFVTYTVTLMYLKNRETKWLILLICCAVLLAVLVSAMVFLRKRIHLACQIIKESSKAVMSILSSLLFPIVPWVLHLMVIAFSVTIFLYLLTVWEPNYRVEMIDDGCHCEPSLNYSHNSTCDPNVFNAKCATNQSSPCPLSACNLAGIDKPWFINYFHVVNIVGFYWLFFFVSAFGEMVLAATFATWYWTFRKHDVPYFTVALSLWRTIRYHLGTLAFGSLILTICRIIRLILEYIHRKLNNANNEVANAILCCCKFFFYLLEKFLRFINKNAYIMCAVHGKGFCQSASDAFNLLLRNAVRVVVINKITSWMLLFGKLLISGLTVLATWFYYTNISANKTDCKNDTYCWVVPVVMTGISSYLISMVFFKVLAAAIDTLFLCFLEDCERNDGSKEKPYFMSNRLRKLLHK